MRFSTLPSWLVQLHIIGSSFNLSVKTCCNFFMKNCLTTRSTAPRPARLPNRCKSSSVTSLVLKLRQLISYANEGNETWYWYRVLLAVKYGICFKIHLWKHELETFPRLHSSEKSWPICTPSTATRERAFNAWNFFCICNAIQQGNSQNLHWNLYQPHSISFLLTRSGTFFFFTPCL